MLSCCVVMLLQSVSMGMYRRVIFLCTILVMPAIFSYGIYIEWKHSFIWGTYSRVLRSLLVRPPQTYSLRSLLDEDCKDDMCMQFLSQNDRDAFDLCTARSQVKPHLGNKSCHFMNPAFRDPVALVSYPGSGNTWVRGLLERATGICTGSVYCDNWLRMHGFRGENIRSGAVLVTKTHYPAVQVSSRIECPPPLWSTGDPEDAETLYQDFESPRWGCVSKG